MTSRVTVRRTKCCGLLSVRIMTVLMCAILIIFATTATLIVAFHFSITAANTVGGARASGIISKVKSDIENFLHRPLSIVIGMQFPLAKGTHLLPIDEEPQNPTWYRAHWDTYVAAMRSADFKYMYATMGFEDSTGVYCVNMSNIWFKCHYIKSENRVARDRKGDATTELINIFTHYDFSLVQTKQAQTNYDPRTRSWYNLVSHTPGAIQWSSVFLSIVPNVVPTVALSAVVFNDTGTMLGVISIGIAIPDIDPFVSASVIVNGSVSVLIDNDDILLASSHIPCITYRNINTSYNGNVPYNCLTSDMKNGATNSVLVCRKTISSYHYPPLRELKSSNPNIISEGTNGESQIMTLDSSDYFITVNRIVTPLAGGMRWRVILFVPVISIVGEIIEARNLAIGISTAIIIAVVIVSFLFVTLLLRPLNTLTEDMYRVATLQDMDDVSGVLQATTETNEETKKTEAESLSPLSEIATLQFAFKAMRVELGEIKGYLPASVLAHLYRDDFSDEGDVNEQEVFPMNCESSLRSTLSDKDLSHIGSETSSTKSISYKKKKDRTFNTVISLSYRRVTMMSLNITDYNATIRANDNNKIARTHSELVSVISSACNEHRGVMDGFMGDRFLVSFNAVTNVGNHAVKAAHAAYTASRAAEAMGTPLMMTAGLASDSALVGNMGSTTIKHFTILGHVVSTAVTLERLAKLYLDGCGVLAAGTIVTDIENFFDVLTVDAAVLPNSTIGAGWRARITAVISPKSASSDEWMYELQESSNNSQFRDANLAFAAFLEGDEVEATNIVNVVLDGNHDPKSTSVGKALKELIDSKGRVDGLQYVNTMRDFYFQCVLPKGNTGRMVLHVSGNPPKTPSDMEEYSSPGIMKIGSCDALWSPFVMSPSSPV